MDENDPSSFLWRLVAIGLITVFSGAVPIVAFSGILGRGTSAEAAETGAIFIFVVICLALVMLAPMYVLWSISFVALRNVITGIRQRAMFSTFVSVLVGNAGLFAIVLQGASPDGRTSGELGLLTLLTALLSVCLTWWAFRKEVRA